MVLSNRVSFDQSFSIKLLCIFNPVVKTSGVKRCTNFIVYVFIQILAGAILRVELFFIMIDLFYDYNLLCCFVT